MTVSAGFKLDFIASMAFWHVSNKRRLFEACLHFLQRGRSTQEVQHDANSMFWESKSLQHVKDSKQGRCLICDDKCFCTDINATCIWMFATMKNDSKVT